MKFLIAGFSEQAQKMVEVLLQLEFPRYSHCSVPRQLTDKYTYIMPNTSANQQKCDFCIVDLDGIGLSQYSVQARENLLKMTNYKPSILISRQTHMNWGRDLLLSKKCVVLNHAHTRQELVDALKKVISLSAVDATNSNLAEQPTIHSVQINPVAQQPSQEMKLAPIAERAKLTKRVLSQRWADYDKYPIVEELLEIFSQSSPYLLQISEHKLLIDPRQGTMVLKTLSCVVDYFILISGFNFSAFKLDAQSLLADDYEAEKERLKSAGYKVYSLNLFIWQIFQEIFPHYLPFNEENVRIKIKYMPNFTALRSVPPYMQALAATCVVSSNSFQDLKARFSYLQDEHIRRFFFLVLISDIADASFIAPLDKPTRNVSAENEEITEPVDESVLPIESKSTEESSNDGVKKAKKTGFLARLLKKLSFG